MKTKPLINLLQSHMTGTELSLNENKLTDAEQYLKQAALNLKQLIEFCPWAPDLIELIRKFKHVSVKYSFALVYNSIDKVNLALKEGKINKAESLYLTIQKELNFLEKEYLNAVETDEAQSAAFIDFSKDYKYLTIYLQQSLQKYNLEKICQNLTRTFNFQETQMKFGMMPSRVFSPPTSSATQNMEIDANPLSSHIAINK